MSMVCLDVPKSITDFDILILNFATAPEEWKYWHWLDWHCDFWQYILAISKMRQQLCFLNQKINYILQHFKTPGANVSTENEASQ